MDLAKHQRRPRLELKLWHHPDNLHALYRESEDPMERSRWHAIWLLFGAPTPKRTASTSSTKGMRSLGAKGSLLMEHHLAPSELGGKFRIPGLCNHKF
jgi:hypothetical protein